VAATDAPRVTVLLALAATTAANAAFLLSDPRLGDLPLWLAAIFLAGGLAYVAAIPLCLRRRRAGFRLATFLGVAGAAVAVADNLALSGSSPNAATFALNVVVVALQFPLVLGSVAWLKAGPAARSPAPPPG